MAKISVDAMDMAKNTTLQAHITRHREYTWRLHIGMYLLGLIARILPMKLEIIGPPAD